MGGFDRATVATIDAAAVRENFAEAGRRAEGRTLFAVLKADAYGHGAVGVARVLVGAGCERLAVVSVEEGLELREAGIELPILVLGGVGTAPEQAVEGRLTPVVHHAEQRQRLSAAASLAGVRVPVQVEVDTGMRRMGVAPDTAGQLLAEVAEDANLELEGVFTHLARADEPDLGPSLEQLAEFRRVLDAARSRGIAPPWVHFANSAGILAGKPLFEALPAANAARPGLMLYGVSPAKHLAAELRPVMTLRTRVVQVRELRAGDAVGYSAKFRAERATRVATLGIGYADGVPVAASNRGQVLIAGRRHPIVGRVSMDYISVDVGEAPVGIGDEAILLGDGLRVEEAAVAAATIPYELLVRVGRRVPRVESSRDTVSRGRFGGS
jgi:alanine racemase